jgi:DNA-binding transcriptional regulator YiaG
MTKHECCATGLKPTVPRTHGPQTYRAHNPRASNTLLAFGNLGHGRRSQKEGVTTLARTKSLSKQIRQAREVKGFTVAQLADRLGVSQVSIYYWESGRVRPRDTNLAALCKALKMPVRETMALTGR